MISARENPFATERVEALLGYEPAWIGQSWQAIDAALARNHCRGAIVGPHGSGKTTLIETLARRLRERGEEVATLFINRQCRTIPSKFLADLDERSLVLFDGAEQLGPLAWRRFRRNCRDVRGLIITAHRPSRLPTLFQTRTTSRVLENCIAILDPSFTAASSEALHKRHRGNVRLALLECYDSVAGA